MFVVAVLAGMAILIFTRLGHYAFWDDESDTALTAEGVMRTGDTSVLQPNGNLVSYRQGANLVGFCDRELPPLATYLTAGSFTLFGVSAWTGRLPFALFGLGTVALLLLWARGERWPVRLVLALGIVGNVSLILYSRQCRYYELAIFWSLAIAFIYWRGAFASRTLLLLAALSVLLFATNYLDYLALYACLAVDYLIWKRKDWPPTWRNAVLLFGPQLLLNGLIGWIWNPLSTRYFENQDPVTIADRVTLFFCCWRDMDRCEFLALPILLLAFLLGMIRRQPWMVRGCIALVVYTVAICAVAPQTIKGDYLVVRYTAPIIPLAIALETGAICLLFRRQVIPAVLAALVVFGTNLLNGGPFLSCGFRSTFLSYLGELSNPPPEPYTPTARWINQHVPAGESIWVEPPYSNYPLMFHAPHALYAWQLGWPPRPDFARLSAIHFRGEEPPDYIIAFGPNMALINHDLSTWDRSDVSYEYMATINVFWHDAYRPELIARTFQPITLFDHKTEAVYIFRRKAPPVVPPAP